MNPVILVTKRLRARQALREMKRGGRVLDIGCGEGYFVRRLRRLGYEAEGIDPAQHSGPIRRGTAEEVLPSLKDKYDYITMLASIEHMQDPKLVLRECARLLEPGGKIIITTPKKKAEWIIRLYHPSVGEEHEQYFSCESISRLLPKGFRLTSSWTFELGLNQVFVVRRKTNEDLQGH